MYFLNGILFTQEKLQLKMTSFSAWSKEVEKLHVHQIEIYFFYLISIGGN